VADVVRARGFEVWDRKGNLVAMLNDSGLTLSIAGLALAKLNAEGLNLWAGNESATVDASGVRLSAAGKTRARVGVVSDRTGEPGGPVLALSDAAGKTRADLTVLSDATPGLGLYDAAGKTRATLSVLDGTPDLALYDAAGETRAIVSLTKDNAPYLGLWDKNGTPRAVLGATSLQTIKTEGVRMRPESSLMLFDKDGKVMWKVP
jgi:hypothetical protein